MRLHRKNCDAVPLRSKMNRDNGYPNSGVPKSMVKEYLLKAPCVLSVPKLGDQGQVIGLGVFYTSIYSE